MNGSGVLVISVGSVPERGVLFTQRGIHGKYLSVRKFLKNKKRGVGVCSEK